MKKIISIILAAVCLMTISACKNAFETEQLSTTEITTINTTSLSYHIPIFSDVPEGIWYEEAVMYCIKNGILSEISDTIFSPSDLMTRAMLADALYRMSDSPAVNNVPTFSDISAGSWCADAVVWVSSKEFISGYGNGLFGADDAVTREQMATILWRYAGSPFSEKIVEFADTSSISEWALLAVSWAKSKGIISGKANNHFAPKDNITRAEAAVMLYRWQNSSENNKKETATKTLVAYFSATGTTQTLAEYAADISGADLYEIVPEQPYTQEDLTYYTNGRADQEQNDSFVRPKISDSTLDLSQYNVIILGYPIWHGQAPKIISTFLENNDFTGKTIAPFCTSHSSGIGSSDTNLHALASGANWLSGKRFSGGTSRNTIEEWINGLDLPDSISAAGLQHLLDFENKTVTLNS